MGMLDLFRKWLDRRNDKFRARRPGGLLRAEVLEYRRMLSPGVTGTTLEVDGTAGNDAISVRQDAAGVTVMVNNVTNNYGPGIPIHTINIFALGGDDQVTVNNVFSTTTFAVDGGSGSNTLFATVQSNTWRITGPNSGTLNTGGKFSNIQNLTSGDFNDNFQFGMNGYVSGTIDGAGGINVLDYSGRNIGATLNLATSTATAIGAGFKNITDFHGSVDNSDMLMGTNSASVWNISGPNSGDVNGQFFYTGVENLSGGTADDQFVFSPTGVERSIIGGKGSNTIDYSARTSAVSTNLSLNASTAIGGSFQQIGKIIGSSNGNDTLIGYNQTNTWTIDGAGSGSLSNTFSAIAYQGYENLIGGTVADTFKMKTGGVVTGTLSGGGGFDKLDFSSLSTDILLNLGNNTVTLVSGGYTSIENIIGSKSVGDQILGANSSTNWDISGNNSGDVNGTLFFGSFESISAGTLDDSFNFQGAGFVTGTIDGGLGVNTLDYSGRHSIPQSGIVVQLNNANTSARDGTATAIGAGFLHISNLIGTPHLDPLPGQLTRAADTLIGANIPNTWNISGSDSGSIGKYTFSDFENLTGGVGVDVFHMSSGGSISGVVNGGPVPIGQIAGEDWLDYTGRLTAVSANLVTGTATDVGKIVNVQNIHGGDGVDKLSGNSTGNVLVGGQAADTLLAGSGNSVLIGGLGSDKVTAGTGHDILIAGYTSYDNNLGALASILAEWNSIWMPANAPQVATIGPIGTSNTVIAVNAKPYTFAAADFGFTDQNDTPANVFTAVKITTIPTSGTLTYNGAKVTAGEFIPVVDIGKAKLVYTPAASTAYSSFTFQVMDNGSTANGGVNLDPHPKAMTILARGPVGTPNTVSAVNNLPYTFATKNFGFTDPTDSPAKSFTGVRISTLPTSGILRDNGKNVSLGQVISVADIGSGKLIYTPSLGEAISSFTFQVTDTGGGVNVDPRPKTMTIVVNINLLLNHLRNGGGLNGSNTLVPDLTVHNDASPDDTAPNVITSGTGPNWLWGGPSEFVQTAAQKAQDITDTPTHNALLLSGSNDATFTTGTFAVLVDPALKITAASATKLASATVQLGENSNLSQDALGFVGSAATGNIVGSYNLATGTLTLSSAGSTATVTQFQTALRKVTFSNNSANPTLGTRTVFFQISDGTYGSNIISSTVSFNAAPVLTGPSNLKYTTLQTSTPVNPNIAVSDSNSVTLVSATVSISTYYQSNQDILTFIGNKATTGDIVGNFDFATGIMTLTSAGLPGTLAQYQAAMRLVSYQDTSSFPLITTRTVSYQVSDGHFASNVIKSTITFS